MSQVEKPRRDLAKAAGSLVIVGLVGRAGSGKSTVAQLLAERGAEVLDADRVGHEVTDTDPEVRAALIAEYGEQVYRTDGHLERSRVAARVFHDPAALEQLNRLVHPRILQRLRERLHQLAERGEPQVVVVDAALMLDWGFEQECDAVIAVLAPEPARVARLMASRHWTQEQASARLERQRPDPEFERAADEVLCNDGSPAELAAATDAALERILTRRRSV